MDSLHTSDNMTKDKSGMIQGPIENKFSTHDEKENIPVQVNQSLLWNSCDKPSNRCSSPTPLSLKRDEVMKKRFSNPNFLSFPSNTECQESGLICHGQSIMWSAQTYSSTDIYKMSSTPKYIKLQNSSSNDEGLLNKSVELDNSGMLEIIGFKKEQCVKGYFINNRLENENFSVNIPISFKAPMSRIYEPDYYYPTLRSLVCAGPRFALVANLQQTYVEKLIIPENIAFELLRNVDNTLIIENDCVLVKFPDKYRKLPLSLCGHFFPISSPEKFVLSQLVSKFPFPQIINFGDSSNVQKSFSFLRHCEENMILTDVFTQCLIVAKRIPDVDCKTKKYLFIPCFNAPLDCETKFCISDIIKVNSHYPNISSCCSFEEADSVAVMNISQFASIKETRNMDNSMIASITDPKIINDKCEYNSHFTNSQKMDTSIDMNVDHADTAGIHKTNEILSDIVPFEDCSSGMNSLKRRIKNIYPTSNDKKTCDNDSYLSDKIKNSFLTIGTEHFKTSKESLCSQENQPVQDLQTLDQKDETEFVKSDTNTKPNENIQSVEDNEKCDEVKHLNANEKIKLVDTLLVNELSDEIENDLKKQLI